MDRRQHQRYDLEAPLSFSWKDQRGIRQNGKGLSSNLSVGGILVSTSDPPPNGTRIRLSVLFPSLFAGEPLTFRALAQVLRVELITKLEGRRFAATIHTFTLHNEQKDTD